MAAWPSATTAMTVTPTSGIRDGQQVSATIQSDVSRHIVTVCESNLALGDVGVGVWDSCFLPTDASGQLAVTEVEPGTPTTMKITVNEHLVQFGGELSTECGLEPGDCSIVDLEIADGANPLYDPAVAALVPIDVERVPVVKLAPQVGLPPSASLAYTGTSFAAKDVLIRQCAAAWAAAPDPATVDHACAAATSVTPTAGAVSTTISVADPLVTVDGTSVPCSSAGCVVVSGYADEPVRVSTPIAFGGATLDLTPSQDLAPNATVHVTASGLPAGSQVTFRLCPVTGSFTCTSTTPTTLLTAPSGTIDGTINLGTGSWYDTSGDHVSCQERPCEVRVTSLPDTRYLAGRTIPVTFAPHRELLLGPQNVGLVPGQDVVARGVNLTPGASYRVQQCDIAVKECDSGPTLVASSSGEVRATVQITQDPGRHGYCRLICWVRLQAVAGGEPDLQIAYGFATMSSEATPNLDLSDGDEVRIIGRNIRPEYAGTPVFLATGRWGIAQCDKAIGRSTTTTDLVTLFTHCGTPDGGGGPVTVTGSAVDVVVRPTATFTSTLGGNTYDCRALGWCVLVLARWEQDGTVTTVTTNNIYFAS